MPLSPPAAARKRLHSRRVTYEGFERADGLFDIDARLVDTKDQDLTLLSGVRPAGEPVHDMQVRVTIDRAFTIRAIEAHTDRMPYPGDCDRIHPAYDQLVGTNLVNGFRRALHDALGGLRQREDEGSGKPFQLDRCHALDTQGDTVRRYYPKWYRGAA